MRKLNFKRGEEVFLLYNWEVVYLVFEVGFLCFRLIVMFIFMLFCFWFKEGVFGFLILGFICIYGRR